MLALALTLYYFRFSTHHGGMSVFSLGGACMLRGETLWTCSPGFSYPPFFAFVMIPFSFLPDWAGNLAWYGVLIGTTYGSYRICETLTVRAFQVAREQLVWLRVFTLILSLKFVLAVLENQAYDVIVFFFVLVGLYGLSMNRTLLAASGLAVAVALKATPVLMLLYALLLRKWKVFALGVGLCAILSVLPDAFFPHSDPKAGYLYRWIVEVAGGGLAGVQSEAHSGFFRGALYFNQSLRPLVYRLMGAGDVAWGDITARTEVILHFVYLAYGLAALAIILRSAKMEGAYLWGASVIVMSMVLLSPVSSKSHFIVLLLPHMVIVAYLMKHREAWRTAVPLLCASFVMNTLTGRGFVGRELSIKMLSLGIITIGTLLLLAAVAVIVFRGGKGAKPAISRR